MRRILTILLLLTTAGCGQKDVGLDLQFVATVAGNPVSCADSGATMSDLRFYVSDVSLSTEARFPDQSASLAAKIVESPPWQGSGVAFVDLESNEGTCVNGTSATNGTVSITLPPKDYKSLRFTVGVPFELNHGNPLLAGTPLNDAAMHWHWRSGYKFMRAGLATEAGNAWIHLGSTGCEGTIGNITGCFSPNRVSVVLNGFDPVSDVIAVDLGVLLDAAQMARTGGQLDCSSGPAEASCASPFAALGIPFGDGAGSEAQSVFSVIP